MATSDLFRILAFRGILIHILTTCATAMPIAPNAFAGLKHNYIGNSISVSELQVAVVTILTMSAENYVYPGLAVSLDTITATSSMTPTM